MNEIHKNKILLLFILIIVLLGCSTKQKESPTVDAVPVKVTNVSKQEVPIPILTSGRLYPKAMVKLSLKVGGIIARIYVSEGDSVKKNQLLASLNLAEIDSQLNQAKNSWLKSQRDLERVKNLYGDRAATLEQLQNTETAYEIAESNLKIAQFNLDHSKIKAPTDGKILKQLAEEGEMIGIGNPIFLFGSTEDRWVIKAGISERDIVRVSLKDAAIVHFDSYPEKQFSASLSEIPQSIDQASGTYEVELALNELDNETVKLAAGFVAKVSIEPSSRESYYLIPVDAIVEGEGDYGNVFSIKDNKAMKVRIKVAHLFPKTVAVSSGLENVKEVVTSGAAYLRDGSTVQVIR